MLLPLPNEGLYLPDARQIVVQQGIHRGGGGALEAVTLVRRERVGQRAGGQQGERGEGQQREHRLQPE
jgi:hypothetical protein